MLKDTEKKLHDRGKKVGITSLDNIYLQTHLDDQYYMIYNVYNIYENNVGVYMY